MHGQESIRGAITRFIHEVKTGEYPAPEHGFSS
jgi:ketopantoate hydroxymethyltransferase